MKGTFNCTRHAALIMKDKGYGRIVNITSSAGLRGNFGRPLRRAKADHKYDVRLVDRTR
jgi:NAD(P)-dependent dehydrogenase (short-subunit alcohol dehydrogenase family)